MKVDSLDLSSRETKTEIETLAPCMVCIFNCKRVQMRVHRKKLPQIVIFFQVLHHLRLIIRPHRTAMFDFLSKTRSLTLTRRRAQVCWLVGWMAYWMAGWLKAKIYWPLRFGEKRNWICLFSGLCFDKTNGWHRHEGVLLAAVRGDDRIFN